MSDTDTETETETPAVTPEQFAHLTAELARYKAKHQETEKHLKAAEEAKRLAAEEAARKSGDMESLEKSWAQREADKIAEKDAEIARRESWLQDMTVNAAAARLAADMAVQGSASVLEPHIKARLAMDIKDGKPVTVVLDKDGKPSALTVDDLRKEIEGSSAFAPLLVGTKASGAGGVSGTASGGITKEQFAKMGDKERVELLRSSPDTFQQLAG